MFEVGPNDCPLTADQFSSKTTNLLPLLVQSTQTPHTDIKYVQPELVHCL